MFAYNMLNYHTFQIKHHDILNFSVILRQIKQSFKSQSQIMKITHRFARHYTRRFFILLILPFLAFSCISVEGEGGKSTVQGYIQKITYNDGEFQLKADTFPAIKTDVYIIYGDNLTHSDKMETTYDGFYQFKYLTKGTYKVFAYNTYPDGRKIAVIDTVFVGRNATKNAKTLFIREGKMLDKSYIKGKVLASYFRKETQLTKDTPAPDIRVFIRRKGAAFHFDDTRSSADGTFMFEKLTIGDYEVFAITENENEVASAVIQEVKITAIGTIVEMSKPLQIRINT